MHQLERAHGHVTRARTTTDVLSTLMIAFCGKKKRAFVSAVASFRLGCIITSDARLTPALLT